MPDDATSTFIYVTYIKTSPQKLWNALLDPDFIRQYWFGMSVKSDWKVSAPWSLSFADGRLADSGEVLEVDAPKRLCIKWRNEFRPELLVEGYSRCLFELEPEGSNVKLTVTHTIEVPASKLIGAVSNGWPKVLSNLKSLLETGSSVLT